MISRRSSIFSLLLIITAITSQPQDWIDDILSFDSLYVNTDLEGKATDAGTGSAVLPAHLPSIANGYLGFQIGSEHLFVSGLFSGSSEKSISRRARVPATVASLILERTPRLHCLLDMKQAVYSRRSFILPEPKLTRKRRSNRGPPQETKTVNRCSLAALSLEAASSLESSCTTQNSKVWIEQRFYAHRVLRHVLVHEIEVLGEDGSAVNYAKPMEDTSEHNHEHMRGHNSHGHYKPESRNKFMNLKVFDEDIDTFDDTPGIERKTGNSWSKPQEFSIGPLRTYASSTWVTHEKESFMDGSTPSFSSSGHGEPVFAVLKLALQGPEAALGIATGSSEEIDLTDVTVVACELAKAQGATQISISALRGCGTEWTVMAGYVKEMEIASIEYTSVVVLSSKLPPNGAIRMHMSGVTIPLLTIVCTSLELSEGSSIQDVVLLAAKQYELAVALAAQGVLFALHATAWREGIWRSGLELDIDHTSSSGSQLAALVNASLYSILSVSRADWPFGMSPGGLSTNGFNGHVFWDQDSFTFPSFNLFWPNVASSMLLYRYHRLPGARNKARKFSGRGYKDRVATWEAAAAFPWESGLTGVETTPSYAPMGEGEIHISGDVSISVWQHYQVTNDIIWLRNVGFPILSGVADFFMSRALADSPGAVIEGKDGKLYFHSLPPHGTDLSTSNNLEWPLHISGVIAATEFYRNVSDNSLTNAVARLSLRYASRAARILGFDETTYYHWENAASRLVLKYFDASASEDSHEESSLVRAYFDGYKPKETVQLLDVPMLHDMFALDNGDPEAVEKVNALGQEATAPERRNVAAEAAKADVRYYLPLFEGGAAFAFALNSMAAARINDVTAAKLYFAKIHSAYVHGPFQVWSEYAGGEGCPNFVTGAASLIDALLIGYAGLRLEDSGITLRPSALPDGARRLRLRSLSLHGHRFTVEFDTREVTIIKDEDEGYAALYEQREKRAHSAQTPNTLKANLNGGAFGLEGALLRSARRLAADHATQAARNAKGWLWESSQHAALEAAAQLFGDQLDHSEGEDGRRHGEAEADIKSIDTTVGEMMAARPWLDIANHQSRSWRRIRQRVKRNSDAELGVALDTTLAVMDESGNRFALRLPGASLSFPLGQTLLIYVNREEE
jgi:trehalose/maltose hydrolase-like predicted phosphorylase